MAGLIVRLVATKSARRIHGDLLLVLGLSEVIKVQEMSQESKVQVAEIARRNARIFPIVRRELRVFSKNENRHHITPGTLAHFVLLCLVRWKISRLVSNSTESSRRKSR